jgi:hypothetical protein
VSKSGGRESLLFLKKKKQKNFYSFGTGSLHRTASYGKKFFASFFQKRRFFLPAQGARR